METTSWTYSLGKGESGVDSLKEHLLYAQSNPWLGEIKNQQAVIHAMTLVRRRHVEKVGIAAKKHISRVKGQSLDAIEVFLQIGTMGGIQKRFARRNGCRHSTVFFFKGAAEFSVYVYA